MSHSSPRLEVQGLTVSYGAARILTDLELTVAPGEIVGMAGRNGAGKTTMLRAISGLVRRQAGSVLLDGTPISGGSHTIARAGISHVPEGRRLFRRLTVRDNLRMGRLPIGGDLSDDEFDGIWRMFPRLERLASARAATLSGGEQQLVAIARGLVSEPKLLMVDELSLGLSPTAAKEALSTLIGVARERTLSLMLVDQNVQSLIATCDRMYVLQRGTARGVTSNDDALLRSAYFD